MNELKLWEYKTAEDCETTNRKAVSCLCYLLGYLEAEIWSVRERPDYKMDPDRLIQFWERTLETNGLIPREGKVTVESLEGCNPECEVNRE